MAVTIITEEMLRKATKGAVVSGLILCRKYDILKTKNDNEYIAGVFQSGVEIPFKVWNNAEAFVEFKNSDYTNVVCQISGKFDDYNNTFSIVVDKVAAVDYKNVIDFLPKKYDAETYWTSMKALVQQNVSEKAMAIANKNLFDNAEVAERFKTEFAASGHHDNCPNGLLVHTYKVLYHIMSILTLYPNVLHPVTQDKKDILILGALFHDIGKTQEMNFGVYQPCSKVTHRYLGIEMIDRASFIEAYGLDGWHELVAIFLQHHGDFEDKCKTVLAQIVHKADCFDADMTFLAQSLETPAVRNGVNTVKIDSNWLSIY